MRRGSAWSESAAATCSVVSVDRRCAVSFNAHSFSFPPDCPKQVTSSVRRRGARKSLGQHFLVDQRIVSRIVGAAHLTMDDTVVEIGPGRGVLTRRLVQLAGTVVAVELDEQLCEELPERLGFPANLECAHADAREADIAALARSASSEPAGGYKVIGNLPYYAANPIVRRVLESDSPPSLALFMVQKEVADSMTAKPGKMGLLSVATQCYASARQVCLVPPKAFRPPPKVRSAVVRLDLLESPVVNADNRQSFFEVVRAGFSAPRKQIHNSLSHGLSAEPGVCRAALEMAGIDVRRRPATVSLEEWAGLCVAWQELQSEREPRAS